MDFSYAAAFGGAGHPDAYERVLIDAVRGDHSLFATSDEVLESWRILQPVLDVWEQGSDDLVIYQPGSAGPA
jgi:glucose-6-phosphate 1-dehydrogenase